MSQLQFKQQELKRFDKIRFYKAIESDSQGEQSVVSCLIVLLGLMLRIKLLVWASLFLYASALTSIKSQQDIKQAIITASLILMGMFTMYLSQNSEKFI